MDRKLATHAGLLGVALVVGLAGVPQAFASAQPATATLSAAQAHEPSGDCAGAAFCQISNRSDSSERTYRRVSGPTNSGGGGSTSVRTTTQTFNGATGGFLLCPSGTSLIPGGGSVMNPTGPVTISYPTSGPGAGGVAFAAVGAAVSLTLQIVCV